MPLFSPPSFISFHVTPHFFVLALEQLLWSQCLLGDFREMCLLDIACNPPLREHVCALDGQTRDESK